MRNDRENANVFIHRGNFISFRERRAEKFASSREERPKRQCTRAKVLFRGRTLMFLSKETYEVGINQQGDKLDSRLARFATR